MNVQLLEDSVQDDFLMSVNTEDDLFQKMQEWATLKNATFNPPENPLSASDIDLVATVCPVESCIPEFEDFIGLSQHIIHLLKRNENVLYNIGIDIKFFNPKEIELIGKKLDDETVFISFLGRYNSGKTTLINALLGIEILPVSDRPETATFLFIQNDDKSNEHSSVRLIRQGCNEASGIQQVKTKLKDMHKVVRLSKKLVDSYKMKIAFPAIKSVNPPHALIVDTPGSNEVGELQLQELADVALKTASAYIYVIRYSDIKNKEDYHALKKIYERDNEIFRGERLTIVVTHYDAFYEGKRETSIPKEEIKSIVANGVKSEIGVEVSPDIVFPVAGKWACYAKAYPETSNFTDGQLALISVLRQEQPSKGFEECFAEITQMERQTAVKKLRHLSGIDPFEKRISSIKGNLSNIWKRNIAVECYGLLEDAIKHMELLKNPLLQSIKETDNNIGLAEEVITHLKTMTDSVQRNSPVYVCLCEAFEKDTDYEKNYKQEIEELLEELKQTIIQNRKQKRIYSMGDLEKDVNEKFSKDAKKKVENLIQKTLFLNCQNELRYHVQKITEKFGRLRAAASMVVDGVQPASLLSLLKGGDGDEENKLFGTLRNVDSTLIAVDLKSIVQISFQMKLAQWLVPWPFPLEVIKYEQIEDVIKDRRDEIEKMYRASIESIRLNILLYFFKKHCQMVMKELTIFGENETDCLIEFLRTKKEEKASLLKKRDVLVSKIAEFKLLQDKIKIFL